MVIQMGQLLTVPVSQIRENTVALRGVNRQSEEYLGLVDSIRTKGFLGAITVRPATDKETGQSYYELVDGLHRFNATKDAGLSEINVDVVSLNDDQVLEAQIVANIHKVETRPVEYSQQLRRILARNPLMTEADLASRLAKSPSWVTERLGLTRITNPQIQALIDEGNIPLSNAYALAKLPEGEMADFLDRAMTLPPDEFVPAVNDRVKEIKEAKRKGQDAAPATFQPVAFLQKVKDVKDEMSSGAAGRELVARTGASTAEEGFALAIQWALHLDPISVDMQRAKDEERKRDREDAKKKREAEAAEKKAAKLAQQQREAAAEAEKAKAALQG
jgi:ParB/RepB/Spo0J family partition protein